MFIYVEYVFNEYKLNFHGYVLLVVNTSRSFPHAWLITGFVAWVTQRVPLVEQASIIFIYIMFIYVEYVFNEYSQ
jgi:hypothetical protein